MLLSEVRRVGPGRVIEMPTHEEHILRVLGESGEPLFLSEITERLNRELGDGAAHRTTEVVMGLKKETQRARCAAAGWTLGSKAVDALRPWIEDLSKSCEELESKTLRCEQSTEKAGFWHIRKHCSRATYSSDPVRVFGTA